jgi:hypothetical protein
MKSLACCWFPVEVAGKRVAEAYHLEFEQMGLFGFDLICSVPNYFFRYFHQFYFS